MAHKHPYSPTIPYVIDSSDSAEKILTKMRHISFQGRSMATALDIWERAVRNGARIFLGLSGAMVPGGMRNIFVQLVRHGLVHCIVTTGANTFHDIHESLGFDHFIGTPFADDKRLRMEGYDRMYDTLASDNEFVEVDRFTMEVIRKMDHKGGPIGTPEFYRSLGAAIAEREHRSGFVVECYKRNVPIFCPAIGDSSLGIAATILAYNNPDEKVNFDVIGDIQELTRLVYEVKETGVVFVGGGTPKNYTQQTEVVAHILEKPAAGHKYCVQFSQDVPHWGGLSGCTFDESISWGKIHLEADKVNVYVDATIALPIIVTALIQRLGINTDGDTDIS
jgi:deoxyhypusine synthase